MYVYIYLCACVCVSVCVCSTICLFIDYLHAIPFVSYSIVFSAVFNLVLASLGLTQYDQSSGLVNVAMTVLC